MDVIDPEMPQIMRLIIALIIVLGLMGGLAFIIKKLGLSADTTFKTNNKRRLKLIESLPLDTRRRMAIVECDGVQHFIILGMNGETVVQNNLTAVDDSKNSDLNS